MNIDFSKGLVPAVVRDARSGAVLTLAYMNEEALARTLESGETWFWSRSRNELWHKGATSGNKQKVVHIAADCDRDALVISVEPAGPACHTGAGSCFSVIPSVSEESGREEARGSSRPAPRPLADARDDRGDMFAPLMTVLRDRHENRPADSYSTYLFNSGRDKILKKVGEEATEVVIAAKGDSNERLVSEVADLVYHLSVLLIDAGLGWEDVGRELLRRRE